MVVLMTFTKRLFAAGLAFVVLAPPAAGHAGHTRQPRPGQSETRKTIEIVAERFLFTPAEITVDRGTTVEFRLTSDDTDHGFRIIGTDIDVTIPKRGRGEAVAVFDAKEAGDYTFECSHICGAGHSFMRGRIRVRAPGEPRGGAGR
jgi:heme/copper-type cytochrome/quinol oxidase subunit 2